MNRFPDTAVIFGTDIECRQRVDAARHADEDAGKHGYENTGRTNRSKREGTGKFADHSDIRHIEDNLQDIRKHERHTE